MDIIDTMGADTVVQARTRLIWFAMFPSPALGLIGLSSSDVLFAVDMERQPSKRGTAVHPALGRCCPTECYTEGRERRALR